jgi:hypothetical protein
VFEERTFPFEDLVADVQNRLIDLVFDPTTLIIFGQTCKKYFEIVRPKYLRLKRETKERSWENVVYLESEGTRNGLDGEMSYHDLIWNGIGAQGSENLLNYYIEEKEDINSERFRFSFSRPWTWIASAAYRHGQTSFILAHGII